MGLFIVEPSSRKIRLLFRDDEMWPRDPAWAPDGKRLEFARGQKTHKSVGALHLKIVEISTHEQLFSIKSDGSGLQQFTHGASFNARPAWSPDVKEVAFCSNRNGSYELYVANPDGANLRQILHDTPDGVRFPSWAPDGREIVFSAASGKAWPLRIVNADGTNVRVVAKVGWHSSFGWTPEPNRAR